MNKVEANIKYLIELPNLIIKNSIKVAQKTPLYRLKIKLVLGTGVKKMASYLHRTAQPPTLATFRSWGVQQELAV